jgi:regulator of protease activity HflC (stomatin/prohibitin superfamily)
MSKLIFGALLLFGALVLRFARTATVGSGGGGARAGSVLRMLSLGFTVLGLVLVAFSMIVVIGPGEVGVQHAFGSVSPKPLLSGIRIVPPWSSVERYSTREEQFPSTGEQVEEMDALSSEQMGMKVDAGVRWQIDPQQAPHIFTEFGGEDQIRSAVRNAVRKGVRDGMVQFSINDIAQRTRIANTMEALVDSALVTQPRGGTEPFRIATVTAFFLRDLQPPAQVVQAINNKIAQGQQIETERHRVEVARLQTEQQRLLNQTLTAEALTKQWIEVLHDMRNSSNLILFVPTEGGLPLLNIGDLRRNLQQQH